MEYLGFFALVFMGAVLLGGVALLNASLIYTADRPSREEKRKAAIVGGVAFATGAFFLYQAFVHAPFEIIAR